MIYPKIIRGYKATPHKIVRNIDGEWYESRPIKAIMVTKSVKNTGVVGSVKSEVPTALDVSLLKNINLNYYSR